RHDAGRQRAGRGPRPQPPRPLGHGGAAPPRGVGVVGRHGGPPEGIARPARSGGCRRDRSRLPLRPRSPRRAAAGVRSPAGPRGHRAADDGKGPSRVRRATRRHALAGRGCVTTTAKVPTDIAIAQAAKLRPVAEIAAELGLGDDEVELYGRYKAKIRLQALARRPPQGRLVLVTGINPTPAGEGKSTVTVGVTQALRKLGNNAGP